MNDDQHTTVPMSGESNPELNNGNNSNRVAPMISAPRTIKKMRIRGALVPMQNQE